MTLAAIVEHLFETYGWDELGERIKIRCFKENPSIKSSLKFLRKTAWARTQVEQLYLHSMRQQKKRFVWDYKNKKPSTTEPLNQLPEEHPQSLAEKPSEGVGNEAD